MQATTEQAAQVYACQWDAGVNQRSLKLDGNSAKFECFKEDGWNDYTDAQPNPVDKPVPLASQLKWIELAGSTNVEVHWLNADHAIFSGRKPSLRRFAPCSPALSLTETLQATCGDLRSRGKHARRTVVIASTGAQWCSLHHRQWGRRTSVFASLIGTRCRLDVRSRAVSVVQQNV